MIKITSYRPYIIKRYMEYFNYDGLATVWDTIYLKSEDLLRDKKLLRHELKHIEQMERDGKILYLIKYHYYWIRYGYKNNPYEIEARNA